jgi:hypothetical protein
MHAPTGYATEMHPTATETAAAEMHPTTPEAAAAVECHRGRCNGDRRSERSRREVSKGFAFHDSDPPPQRIHVRCLALPPRARDGEKRRLRYG